MPKPSAGREVFYKLVEGADVVVENYRPEVKYRLGIDYETLKAINPRIVLGISGFGQELYEKGPLTRSPTRAHPCADGHFNIAAGGQDMFERLAGRSAPMRSRPIRITPRESCGYSTATR